MEERPFADNNIKERLPGAVKAVVTKPSLISWLVQKGLSIIIEGTDSRLLVACTC